MKQKLLSSLALGALVAMSAGAAQADDTAAEIRLLRAQLQRLEAKVAAQERATRETKVAVARVATGGGGGIVKGAPPVEKLCPGGGIAFKGIIRS